MTVASPEVAAEQASCTALVPLPQLLEPASYIPDTLLDTYAPKAVLAASGKPDYPSLEDWIEIFRHSIASFQATAEADPSLPELERRACSAEFAAAYRKTIDEVERAVLEEASSSGAAGEGEAAGRRVFSPCVGCLELCRLREEALLTAGFRDIFLPIKQRENAQALELLGDVCAEIDSVADPVARWEMALRGVFAGNIFDLGTAATTAMYHEQGGVAFHATRDKLLPRPWVVDCLDELVAALSGGRRYTKAVLFVDNSGADVVLGMLPFARELVRRGVRVVIAANERPSINDITAHELDALLPAIGEADGVLCKAIATRQLSVVSSGSCLPVIDLAHVSAELAEAADGADLVVLEGMGRSIETNLRTARFSCDAAFLGMIKHPEVAAALGGRLFDCVCSFVTRD